MEIKFDSGEPKLRPRAFRSATLITIDYSWAETQTAEFGELRFEIETFIAGNVVIRTRDGKNLLVMIQHAMSMGLRQRRLGELLQQRMADRMQYDAEIVGCAKPSPGDTRHREVREQKALRRDQGVDHLCWWEPLGHSDPGAFNVSRDFMRTAGAFSALSTLSHGLAPFFEVANVLSWATDPDWHAETMRQYQLKLAGNPFDRLLNTSGHFCWQGVAIVRNLSPNEHPDITDDRTGLASMTPLGDYKGGSLHLPQFGLRLQYRPHSVCVLRSALLVHHVADFAGWRHSVVLFWRESFRRLSSEAVDWDAIRYGFRPRWGSQRPVYEDEVEFKERVKKEGKEKNCIKSEWGPTIKEEGGGRAEGKKRSRK